MSLLEKLRIAKIDFWEEFLEKKSREAHEEGFKGITTAIVERISGEIAVMNSHREFWRNPQCIPRAF